MTREIMPRDWTPEPPAAAKARPVPTAAQRATVATALAARMAGKPLDVHTARELVQTALAEAGVRLTNDEALAELDRIEKAWHPGGVPARFEPPAGPPVDLPGGGPR